MSLQPKYKMYATILDSFSGYLNSSIIYNRYWGFSENPPMTEEEFEKKQFSDLIDRINRVPFDSEPADKGTAFNEIIDCLIENRKSEQMELVSFPSKGIIQATYKERTFAFPLSLCKEFAEYFKGAICQLLVEGILDTHYGPVLLYGYIDELMPMSVHDIKTTGKYSAFKFKDHWQHIVYPFCLMQSGNHVTHFEYNVTDFKEIFTELYVFQPERDIPILTKHVEAFIEFLEYHRDLITDKKIFAKV